MCVSVGVCVCVCVFKCRFGRVCRLPAGKVIADRCFRFIISFVSFRGFELVYLIVSFRMRTYE